jgi:CrcB protein
MELRTAAYVGLGGVCGAVVRWAIGEAIAGGSGWPWAIFVANLVGCLVLGALLARYATSTAPAVVALTTGFCGALTTFSSFAVDLAVFLRDGRLGLAVAYLLVSLLAGLGTYRLGFVLSRPGIEAQ